MKTKKLIAILLSVITLITLVPVNSASFSAVAEVESNYNVGDIIEFGSYPQSEIQDISNLNEGTDYIVYEGKYYKIEPIRWIVLQNDNGKLFIWSQKCIDESPYNDTSEDQGSYYANNYEMSVVRSMLIDSFYYTAFDEREKSIIYPTTIDNSAVVDKYSADPTTDYVFLISKSEALSLGKNYLAAELTDYTAAHGIEPNSDGLAGSLTRTAAYNSYSIYYIQLKWGSYVVYYNWYDDAITVPMPVRPAMYIDSKALEPQYPAGYDHTCDKYPDVNPEKIIDVKYYQKLFGDVKGHFVRFGRENKNHGLCYGMAATTGSLLQHNDVLSSYSNTNTLKEFTCLKTINVTNQPESVCNYFGISALDYVKYAYITQFASDVQQIEENTSGKLHNLVDAVKAYTDGYGDPVIICLRRDNENHAVFAVGYQYIRDEIIIFTDDSNHTDSLKQLIIKNDYSSWSYQSYLTKWSSEDNDTIQYNDQFSDLIFDIGYMIHNNTNNYLSSDTNLVSVNGSITSNSSMQEIKEAIGLIESEGNNVNDKQYWLEEGIRDFEYQQLSENALVALSDCNSAISVSCEKSANVTVKVDDDSDNYVNISSEENGEITTTLTSSVNNELHDIRIRGNKSESDVTISEKSDGTISVTGLNDIHVTYSIDNEIAATNTITINDCRNVNITVDKENNIISSDYVDSMTESTTESAFNMDNDIIIVEDETQSDIVQCKYCGEYHNNRTVNGWFTEFFHNILFVLKNLFFLWSVR